MRKNHNGGMIASSPVNATRKAYAEFQASRGGQTRNQMTTDGRNKSGKNGVDRTARRSK